MRFIRLPLFFTFLWVGGFLTLLSAQIEHLEDFENFVPGQFPGPTWIDVRAISIPATAPAPSARIIETLAWDATETQALQFAQGVTTSCGIFREVGPSAVYQLSADIRIDQWSNSTQAFFTEWAVSLGVFSLRSGWDFNGGPQITFVAQPVAQNWVLYALRSDTDPFDFYNLEFTDSKIELNTWYQVEFTLYDDTGVVHTRVTEKATGMISHEAMTPIPNWTPGASGNFEYYGSWDGEYNTDASIGNQATVDNFSFSNATSTALSNPIAPPAIQVFPNPARDEVFIKTPHADRQTLALELMDCSGRVWKRLALKPGVLLPLAIDDLPNGIYCIREVQTDKMMARPVRFVKL